MRRLSPPGSSGSTRVGPSIALMIGTSAASRVPSRQAQTPIAADQADEDDRAGYPPDALGQQAARAVARNGLVVVAVEIAHGVLCLF